MRPLIALAIALMLSAPLHAERNEQVENNDQAEHDLQEELAHQAKRVLLHCHQTNEAVGEAESCFRRFYYTPLYARFCLQAVFLHASPPPSPSELSGCVEGASHFASKEFMDARGVREISKDEG